MICITELFSILALLGIAQGAPTSASSTLSSLASLVAFGDELSDNGNGSFAHGMTGETSVYGFDTWTNGPVAVSYMADTLNLPLIDYAFGGCCGGGSAGATLDDSYTPSDSGAPSIQEQVANYTSAVHSGNLKPKKSMGFIWAGVSLLENMYRRSGPWLRLRVRQFQVYELTIK